MSSERIEAEKSTSTLRMYSYSLFGRVKGTRVQKSYPGDVVHQFFLK